MTTPTMTVRQAWLKLLRLPNLFTAAADALTGLALVGAYAQFGIGGALAQYWPLVMASVCLYAGGVVLNDAFDAELDAVERPERPIPQGIVSQKQAFQGGILLLALGVLWAMLVAPFPTGVVAGILAGAIVAYNGWAKKSAVLGPVTMGLCRALNLLMALSIGGVEFLSQHTFVGVIPFLYIFSVTLISRDEVKGGKRWPIWLAMVVVLLVIGSAPTLLADLVPPTLQEATLARAFFFSGLSFYLMLVWFRAQQNPIPENIRSAVKAGVLGLVVLDAAMAATVYGFAGGILVFSMLLGSRLVARLAEVT